MTQIVTVEKKLGAGYVEISVPRKSACGHDCEECAGCGMTARPSARGPRIPWASRRGRRSSSRARRAKLLGVVALVYVLPVAAFLLGYFLSPGLAEGVRYAIAIGAAALMFVPIVAYDRYARRHETLTYTVVRRF